MIPENEPDRIVDQFHPFEVQPFDPVFLWSVVFQHENQGEVQHAKSESHSERNDQHCNSLGIREQGPETI